MSIIQELTPGTHTLPAFNCAPGKGCFPSLSKQFIIAIEGICKSHNNKAPTHTQIDVRKTKHK